MKLKKMRALSVAVIMLLFTVLTCTLLFYINKSAKLQNALSEEVALNLSTNYKITELQSRVEQLTAKENANTVYLTFDDGPSDNTVKILDILAKYNIKATFFVTGKESESAKAIYNRIVMEGHGVGNHTYSHSYKEIYTSTEKFWQDIQKNDRLFFDATGKHLEIIRFPGGSNNTVSEKYCKGIMKKLVAQAKEKGIIYFDWNVCTKDAEAALQSKQTIVNAALQKSQGLKESIILMHDSAAKITTVEALPEIIEALKNRGCVFKTLDCNVPPVQFQK